MPISVSCGCGKKFAAPSKLAGKKVKCPACSEPIRVPGAAASKTNGKASASITVPCDCGKSFRAPAKLAGKKVKCPACDQAVRVPAGKSRSAKKEPVAAGVADGASTVGSLLDEIGFQQAGGAGRCPNCKTDLLDDAILCVDCGYNLETGKMMRSKVKKAAKEAEVDDGIAPDHIANAEAKAPGGSKALMLVVLLVVLGAVVVMRMGLIPGLSGS